ncbi:MAG: class I SAM-dependent methyltransferase [Halobacteriales archaeon]
MAHTFDAANADVLDDVSRYRFLSRDELLGALDPAPEGAVADLGSGTGFYTAGIAPHAGTVYAVDVQSAMHARFRENGVPGNVSLVTAAAGALPFRDGCLDAAVSTMTFHEVATPDAMAEIARVLAPRGRLVTADWSAAGEGAAGPPLAERRDAAAAADLLAGAGFRVERASERPETFLVVAAAP